MASYELPLNWLRNRLQQHGISQRQLADALDIDPATCSRLVAGKRRLRFDELPKLVTLFGTNSPDWRLDLSRPAEHQYRGRLEGALKVTQMDPTVLADLIQLPQDTVFAALEKGGAVTDERLAEATAKLLGVSRGWLQMNGGPFNAPDVLYGLGRRWGTIQEPSSLQLFEVEAPPITSNEKSSDVPIYAAARHLSGGEYEWSETVAETRVMPLMSRVTGAWGLIVGSAGIPPRFPSGAVLYIHPHAALRPGDFAIFRAGARLMMGTVALESGRLRVLDGSGEPIEDMEDQPLEKVALVTFE